MKDPERLLSSDATAWEARLLRAAHDEEPSAAARAALTRTLGLEGATAPTARAASPLPRAAHHVARKLVSKWLLLAGASAALLGGVPWLLRATSRPNAVPETVHSVDAPSVPNAPQVPATAAYEASERRVAEVEAQQRESEPPSAPPAHEHGAAPSLAQELASLERARAALQRASPARALTLLLAHERRYPHGTLREEALALRWEALLANGDSADAVRVARVFLRRYPRSVHAVRIRAQLEQAVDAR